MPNADYEHSAPSPDGTGMWCWNGELDSDTVIYFESGTTSTLSEAITATNGAALEWWEDQLSPE